ncbi:MAG: hypothetical protein PHQ96_07000, partial [Candidatus Omnitrophica bacterium]|nr:hypothetical protein [Candidatus Omnitrophota bacterium]
MSETMPRKKILHLISAFSRFNKALLGVKYLIDLALVIISYWFSYIIRFEGVIPNEDFVIYKKTIIIFAVSFFVCDFFFGLARGIWRYTSLRDIERTGFSV